MFWDVAEAYPLLRVTEEPEGMSTGGGMAMVAELGTEPLRITGTSTTAAVRGMNGVGVTRYGGRLCLTAGGR